VVAGRRIDVLYNNAGAVRWGAIDEASTAGLRGSVTNKRVAHSASKAGVIGATSSSRPRAPRTGSGSTRSAPG